MIAISDRIGYIEAAEEPLSADVGVVRGADGVWLYDVGNGERSAAELDGSYTVVLSHFHADHVGNLGRIRAERLFVSPETYRHTGRGTVVREELRFGDLRVFPLPSCHAKGCLGLEIGEEYAFVGDALYSRVRDGFYAYNAQVLREEIAALRALRSPKLLVSHFPGLVRDRKDAVEELEAVYARREKDTYEILVPAGER